MSNRATLGLLVALAVGLIVVQPASAQAIRTNRCILLKLCGSVTLIAPPSDTLSVSITPDAATVTPGGSQVLTARSSLGTTPLATTAPGLSLTWSVPSTFGQVTSTSAPQTTFQAGSATGTGQVSVLARYAPPGQSVRTATRTVVLMIAGGTAQITGDVFAGGNVSGLTVDRSSVVSASGTISNVATTNTIANYTRETVAETSAAVTRLLKEKAVSLPINSAGQATIGGTFNLNPKKAGQSTDTADNTANPEGGVWYVPGDLKIDSALFRGRGTIVVDGDVTVEGSDTKYATDTSLVGIIARGNVARSTKGDITIGKDVKSVVGSYYAPKGTIRFDGTGASSQLQSYTFVTKWGSRGAGAGQFENPTGITVDSAGNVYVANASNGRIQKFTSDGRFLLEWGSNGTSDGQFRAYPALAVDATGNVYVADNDNHRIQKFTSTGTFLTKWGSRGEGNGQFINPTGITVDSTGNVYVSDFLNSRIQKFTSTGTFLTKWGSYESLVQPSGLAVDSTDNVYVYQDVRRYIQKFTSDGRFLTEWPLQKQGEDFYRAVHAVLAVDRSGNVYVSSFAGGPDTTLKFIKKFSTSGTLLSEWGPAGTNDGQLSSALNYPVALAVDSTGNVYVADTGNQRVQKFTPGTSSVAPSSRASLTATGLFVGNKVELLRPLATITYDGRITKTPPLGFSQRFTPAIGEVTP